MKKTDVLLIAIGIILAVQSVSKSYSPDGPYMVGCWVNKNMTKTDDPQCAIYNSVGKIVRISNPYGELK